MATRSTFHSAQLRICVRAYVQAPIITSRIYITSGLPNELSQGKVCRMMAMAQPTLLCNHQDLLPPHAPWLTAQLTHPSNPGRFAHLAQQPVGRPQVQLIAAWLEELHAAHGKSSIGPVSTCPLACKQGKFAEHEQGAAAFRHFRSSSHLLEDVCPLGAQNHQCQQLADQRVGQHVLRNVQVPYQLKSALVQQLQAHSIIHS